MIPLFFQVILLESASKAGARLVIPSLGTPTGAMIAGIVMSRWGRLIPMIRLGAFLMVCGNSLMLTLAFKDANWKYYAFLVPASLGQGFMYPSILFTSLASFEHSGMSGQVNDCTQFSSLTPLYRPRGVRLDCLSHPVARNGLGGVSHFRHPTNYASYTLN